MFEKPFTKDNLEYYLKELSKEFRKLNGKSMPAEIILIGGASVILNYGFREMTYDMDAIINASSAMKDAINKVGDRFDLPTGWLNTDFKKTTSYTSAIIEHSEYYKTFSNIVTIRTVRGEYLIAMKLMAGRLYKYDLSDVTGILKEHNKTRTPISLEQIKKAVCDLYGSYEALPEKSRLFVEKLINEGRYEERLSQIRKMEIENKGMLLQFQQQRPGELTRDIVDDIINYARRGDKPAE